MKQYTQPEKLSQQIIEKCLDSHKVTNSLLISIDILSRLNNIGLEISQPTPDVAEGAGDIARCIETIEKSYVFADGNIPLQKCGEWKYLKELVTTATPKPAPDAVRARIDVYRQRGGMLFSGFTVADDFETALSAPVPSPDGARRKAFYSILTKFIPQETIDEAWQKLKEAGLVL